MPDLDGPDPDATAALAGTFRDPGTVVLPTGAPGVGPLAPVVTAVRARVSGWDVHVVVRLANAAGGPARALLGDVVRHAETLAGASRADWFRAAVALAAEDGRLLLPDDVDHDPATVAGFRDPLTEVLAAGYATLVVHDLLGDGPERYRWEAAGLGLLDAALRPERTRLAATAAVPDLADALVAVPTPVEPAPSPALRGVHRAWGWGIVHGVGGRPMDAADVHPAHVDPFRAWFGWDRSVASTSDVLLAHLDLPADHPLRVACRVLAG